MAKTNALAYSCAASVAKKSKFDGTVTRQWDPVAEIRSEEASQRYFEDENGSGEDKVERSENDPA